MICRPGHDDRPSHASSALNFVVSGSTVPNSMRFLAPRLTRDPAISANINMFERPRRPSILVLSAPTIFPSGLRDSHLPAGLIPRVVVDTPVPALATIPFWPCTLGLLQTPMVTLRTIFCFRHLFPPQYLTPILFIPLHDTVHRYQRHVPHPYTKHLIPNHTPKVYLHSNHIASSLAGPE